MHQSGMLKNVSRKSWVDIDKDASFALPSEASLHHGLLSCSERAQMRAIATRTVTVTNASNPKMPKSSSMARQSDS